MDEGDRQPGGGIEVKPPHLRLILEVHIVDQEDHIRRLDDGRHVITDCHGMRYLVPEPEKLDHPSRRWLARYC